jgi:hypothetical protein
MVLDKPSVQASNVSCSRETARRYLEEEEEEEDEGGELKLHLNLNSLM